MWKIVILVIVFSSFESISSQLSNLDYRLPDNTVPEAYVISLVFDDVTSNSGLKFNGSVEILLNIKEDSNEIILHCHPSIKISSLQLVLRSQGKPEFITTNETLDAEREFLIISTEQKLSRGTYPQLYIDYVGDISDEIPLGVYRGSYNSQNQIPKRFLQICDAFLT